MAAATMLMNDMSRKVFVISSGHPLKATAANIK